MSWTTVALCVPLLCSCATPKSTDPSFVDVEVPLNAGAGSRDWLYVTLQLENGTKLVFSLDTGAPVTVLDWSLEPQLGKRIERTTSSFAWREMPGGIYKAPKLYLANTLLHTSDTIWTADLRMTNSAGLPVMGILGMDVLRHYAVQLDFGAGQARFLQSRFLPKAGLCRPFSLTVYPAGASGYVAVHQNFTGTKGVNPIIDTGCMVDALLEPKEFELALRNAKAVFKNEFRDSTGIERSSALFSNAAFASSI